MNYGDSIQLFSKLAELGCKKIVYASSTAVYGKKDVPMHEGMQCYPLNPYGVSKRKLDDFVVDIMSAKKYRDISIIGLRFCNIYGPREGHKGRRMSMVGKLIRHVMRNQNPILFTPGDQERDFLYIEDALAAIVKAAESTARGYYNIASGKTISFNNLLKLICEKVGKNKLPRYIDNPNEKAYQDKVEVDIAKAKADLQYSPKYDIKLGVEKYVDNLRKAGRVSFDDVQ